MSLAQAKERHYRKLAKRKQNAKQRERRQECKRLRKYYQQTIQHLAQQGETI